MLEQPDTYPDKCSCGRIRLGLEVTENRNWNPDCTEHGVRSAWYSSDETQRRFKETRDQSVRLQMLAREARKT